MDSRAVATMTDSLTTERRSWNMSRIRGKDTVIELKVRRFLFSEGFRYRIHVRNLPGKPDIVLKKYRTVIFIHGCFWHRHQGCKDATIPKTRTEFWMDKFQKNVINDESHVESLAFMGWNVIVLWECEIERKFDNTMAALLEKLKKHGDLQKTIMKERR